MAIDQISDPRVKVVNADGLTPEGLPYYQLRDLGAEGTLLPGESSESGQLRFSNPTGEQFSYELLFLARLNQAPEFISAPKVEALVSKNYTYDAEAVDANEDVLSYQLLVSPAEMTIDEETGIISWSPTNSPTNNDLGTHTVIVEVDDGRGAQAEQQYQLSVIDALPNRPPIITSVPIVDGNIDRDYNYQVIAEDADGDPLNFTLEVFPTGMTIEADSGLVNWTPDANQSGIHQVQISVSDQRGGTATQAYQILVETEVGNNAPIFISEPVTDFNLPGISNPANGDVDPTALDLELALDEVAAETVSITLPSVVIPPDDNNNGGTDNGNGMPLEPQGFDTIFTGFIDQGERETFNFTAPAGLRVYLDSQINTSNIRFELFNPDGTTIPLPNGGGRNLSDEGPLTFAQAGTYTLTIQALNDTFTGDYRFALINGSAAPSLPLNSAIADSLDPGRESDLYQFTGTAGQPLIFKPLEGNSTTQLSLVGPGNQFVLNRVSLSTANLEAILPENGNYLLVLSNNSDNPLDYNFEVASPEMISTALTFGETIAEAIAEIGEEDIYTFSGTQGQQIYFDGLGADSFSILAKLIAPDGTNLFNRFGQSLSNNVEPFTLTETGTYQVMIDGRNQVTGNYSFRILDLTSASTLALDAPITNTLTPGRKSDLYQFTGTAGTQLLFNNQTNNSQGKLVLYGVGNQKLGEQFLNVSIVPVN